MPFTFTITTIYEATGFLNRRVNRISKIVKSAGKLLQRVKQQRRVRQMRRFALFADQAETFAVGRAVHHAQISHAFRKLPARRGDGVRPPAVRLEFPADDFRLGKPAAQLRDDFRRRQQFDKQFPLPRGNFFCRFEGQPVCPRRPAQKSGRRKNRSPPPREKSRPPFSAASDLSLARKSAAVEKNSTRWARRSPA